MTTVDVVVCKAREAKARFARPGTAVWVGEHTRARSASRPRSGLSVCLDVDNATACSARGCTARCVLCY